MQWCQGGVVKQENWDSLPALGRRMFRVQHHKDARACWVDPGQMQHPLEEPSPRDFPHSVVDFPHSVVEMGRPVRTVGLSRKEKKLGGAAALICLCFLTGGSDTMGV